jgi:hypothetical protein
MNCISKLRRAVLLSALFAPTCFLPVYAQMRWDGGAGDGQWTTAANWAGDILPSSTDDVLFDNSFVTANYFVSLPGGMGAVSVRSIVIQPSAGNTIELILSLSNNATPAVIISGPGYGLTIHNGGIFRNASGISSGQSIQVADSIRINNGGRYIHQTRGSHAGSISQILSRAPGTETGIVEFDVPGTTGYVISASTRVYGTLILSANAAGSARTYSSSGGSDLTVRGDLQLNAGVSYNINLAGNIIVDGNLVHSGQSLNISSGGDNTILRLKGHLSQSGIITETSTGLPVIELCGKSQQQIQVAGSIINSVSLRMNNAAGAVLQSAVSLPWKLELINGKITGTQLNLLTLMPDCEIIADSLSNSSFVDGPLRKEGLTNRPHFLFPVGKDQPMRWLALKNASGSFTVEYFKSDPRLINASYGAGIDHISQLEYWTIEGGAAMASPELSFTDPNSGGVTDLSTLRVAQLNNDIWTDAGNIATTGTAGANGSVTGNLLTSFSSSAKYFTLSGSDANSNPLPVSLSRFSVKTNGHINTLSWIYEGDADFFEVMYAPDNRQFSSIGKIYPAAGRRLYQFKHMKTGTSYYQMRMMRKNENFYESPVLVVTGTKSSDWLLSVTAGDQLTLTITASTQKAETGRIFDASGRMVKQFSFWLRPGVNNLSTDISNLPPGVYSVRMLSNSMPFVKW